MVQPMSGDQYKSSDEISMTLIEMVMVGDVNNNYSMIKNLSITWRDFFFDLVFFISFLFTKSTLAHIFAKNTAKIRGKFTNLYMRFSFI